MIGLLLDTTRFGIMRTSWADSVTAENEFEASSTTGKPSKPAYVPPHLRNRPPSSEAPQANERPVYAGPSGSSRWAGGSRPDFSRGGGVGGGYRGGRGGGPGWNNRGGGWDRGRDREVDPFGNEAEEDESEQAFEQENTGINFDAYEDIPVETSGENVPPPVNTFAEIDLGKELNANIRRCKYVKPTPVQRHAIPISLAGRDLMACAQTGSGKTAAFCFPIISGIMKNQQVQRPRGYRTVFPLALILSPTRELSMQVRFCF